MYMDDYDDMVVPDYEYVNGAANGYTTILWYPDLMWPYIKSAGVFVCPDRSFLDDGNTHHSTFNDPDRTWLPVGTGPGYQTLTFSYSADNSWDCCGLSAAEKPNGDWTGDTLGRYWPFPIEAAFQQEASYITFFDSDELQTWAAAYPSANQPGDAEGYDYLTAVNGMDQAQPSSNGVGPNCYGSVRKDHSGGFNAAYMDGHAKWSRESNLSMWAAQQGINWSWTY